MSSLISQNILIAPLASISIRVARDSFQRSSDLVPGAAERDPAVQVESRIKAVGSKWIRIISYANLVSMPCRLLQIASESEVPLSTFLMLGPTPSSAFIRNSGSLLLQEDRNIPPGDPRMK
jgi:hypothetical protein